MSIYKYSSFQDYLWYFFKIYKILQKPLKSPQEFRNKLWIFWKFMKSCEIQIKFANIQQSPLVCIFSGTLQHLLARKWFSCRPWKTILQNAYLDAKIGVDPTENDPRKEFWVVAQQRTRRRRRRCGSASRGATPAPTPAPTWDAAE